MHTPEMSISKKYSDNIKCMYFMIEDKKIDKYMTIWEKLSSIIRKINSKHTYNKKYLKAEKRFNAKEGLFLYTSNICLIYRKNRNYYSKVFLEKFVHNYFWRRIINFVFLGSENSS